MDTHSLTSLISEVLSLVGLALGVALYLAGAFVRGIKGRWIPTDGVIAASGPGTVIRWFDQDGEVHECPATTNETHQLSPGQDVPLWFNSRTPSHCRTHAPEIEGRGLRLTGLILLGTGLAAAVLGFVLMFV
ncbi:hypothetical protein RCH16_002553 [Cryobacterium sp. MP_M5]|uniref:DUF3592 domain-containing protein n=1 Tax=unclassified Cryobacterium TaxID=2649013 RepID=UPI0018CAEA5D|nr:MULTISPECIES: DUF3592 domain-containing protein [unclassified Cryobacterium]MBG6059241.1 hypothetical protein [Cryobacterium sp. MP_M3]MEC5177535.1 hypothetical protein [Cryobacterium sp. MP_M5]